MKTMNAIAFMAMLLLFAESGFSQKVKANKNSVRLEVIQNDDRLVKYPGLKSEVVVYFSNYALGGYEISKTKDIVREEFIVPLGGRFTIEFPATTGKVYMRMFYVAPVELGGNPAQSIMGAMDNVFVFEPGDDVQCTITLGAYTFTGKGATKLNCQSEIFSKQYVSRSDHKSALFKAGKFEEWLALDNREQDTTLNKRLAVLKKYKKELPVPFYQMLLANCYALRYYDQWRINIINSRENPAFYAAFKKSYQQVHFPVSIATFPEDVLASSPLYANYLFQKLNVDLRLSNDKWLQVGPDYSDYIQRFNKDLKKGTLKDKLYAQLLFRKMSPGNDYSAYIDQALQEMSGPLYKKIFNDVRDLELKGALIVEDSFMDASGKEIRLTDFKNKVMIVEFWFTGCPGCAGNKKAMEPVVAMFKNNPDVGFITISIDTKKEDWLKSLKAGTYTGDIDINLYTKGLGSKHPFIEKYRINSYPTTYIIKNGKMISSKPPEVRAPGGREDLIAFINKSIKE